MRSVQECAEQARRFVRLAAREKDPELKKRLLRHAKNHQVLARLAESLARKSRTTSREIYRAHGRGRHSPLSPRAKSGKFYPPRVTQIQLLTSR